MVDNFFLDHFLHSFLVKQEMDHGEITNEAFDQVWNECFNEVNSFFFVIIRTNLEKPKLKISITSFQVLFLPNEKRYTRAMMASKKDRVDSFEKRLEINKNHMKREAKKAGKQEKTLRVSFGILIDY